MARVGRGIRHLGEAIETSPVRALAVTGLVALLLVVAVVGKFLLAATPPRPTDFYTPPAPLPAGAPGTLLRSEPITANLPRGAVAWRILYLSTGVQGEPIAVSGIVVAPQDKGSAPHPVVAWAHGTLGVVPACGTSHAADPFKYIPINDSPALQRMIDDGYVVAATDYPGLGTPGVHPYLVGPVAAASVLDSVRAARQLDVNASTRFVVWGHSQGGNSALWTGQDAFSYASELQLLGVAAAAPATDLVKIVESNLETRAGGVLIAQALYAWSFAYPQASLDAVIKPEMRAQVERIARTCITTPEAFLLVGQIPTARQFLALDPATTDPWQTIAMENTPRGAIDAPILLMHGTTDSVIPFDASVAEAAHRCAEGENVQFMRYPGDDHNQVMVSSAVATVGWIEDRFAGRPAAPNCA
jgi:alpha-beta hydrolase superfamily lysophospholipase